jgi:lysophospholipase L1-like esterase
MNRRHFVVRASLASMAIATTSVRAQQPKVLHREKVEWTWADRSDPLDPKLPNVLLVGDSITRGYFPEVAKQFAGKANVYLFATSCSSGDPRLAGQLREFFLMQPSFAVIHFNNGMHGWAYDDQTFAAELPAMIELLRQQDPGAHLLWATITPVRRDDPAAATNARIATRNAAALAIMKRQGIPVDDQHTLMEAHGDLHLDDVHFNDAGSQIQGDQAARSIQAAFAAK